MSHALTVELDDATYQSLQQHARAADKSPADLAAAALEQHFARQGGTSDLDKETARARFERHFGEVDLGKATGIDNEDIDADLARAYADIHEGS